MWYIVLSHSRPEKDAEKERNYEAHRQWLDDQHRAGRLLFSGPTTDGAYGIYVMLAHRAFRLNGPTITELEQMSKPAAS
jgi:uncharacterized protein YciI